LEPALGKPWVNWARNGVQHLANQVEWNGERKAELWRAVIAPSIATLNREWWQSNGRAQVTGKSDWTSWKPIPPTGATSRSSVTSAKLSASRRRDQTASSSSHRAAGDAVGGAA
jgi:hypothetical protein